MCQLFGVVLSTYCIPGIVLIYCCVNSPNAHKQPSAIGGGVSAYAAAEETASMLSDKSKLLG